MKKRNNVEQEALHTIFELSNTLQQFLDNQLKENDLTAKQFFLLIAIDQLNETSTLSNIASILSTSHQNVKVLAKKAQSKGFITIEPVKDDKRKKRLVLTKKAMEFFASRERSDQLKMNELFQSFPDEELQQFNAALKRVSNAIKKG